MQEPVRPAKHEKPRLPIPTALAWLLLESLFGSNPLERIATVAAEGAALSGQSETKALERHRKMLRRSSKGHRARPTTEAEFLSDIKRACREKLRKAFSPERVDELIACFDVAGPFTVLAFFVMPDTPTKASRRLLRFSEAMDQLGAAFFEAVAHDEFARARDLLLESDCLDHDYWVFPGAGLSNAEANCRALRAANDWHLLVRAAAPLNLTVSLSWLSMLDIATLSAGKYNGADFSLFEPLIAPPLSTRTSSGAHEADRSKLPVTNLIRMLERIAHDVERNQTIPSAAAARDNKNVGEKAALRDSLKKFKRFDLLSIDRFISLLRCLTRPGPSQDDEGCGFDVISLLLGANLFSLLTPRDGARPTSFGRRKVPDEIACFPEFANAYNQWWHRNHAEAAGGATKHPRPVWLSGDSSENVRRDRRR